VLGSLFLLILANFAIDPYAIFYRDPNSAVAPNERFIKMNFLEQNKNKYQGFLIGSSRIGTTEPKYLERYIKDVRFYNLTIAAGTLGDFQILIKRLLQSQVQVKYIYLQIDVFDNLTNYTHDQSALLLKMKPEDENIEQKVQFYRDYLLSHPYETLWAQLERDFNLKNEYRRNDFFQSGCWYEDSKERELHKNANLYVKKEKTFYKKEKIVADKEVVFKNLAALKNIVSTCQQNNIKLILFVTPHNKNMLKSINYSDYLDFLKSLAQINDYWDFSGFNTITMENKNYYEYSHYRPYVGQLITGRIFHDDTVNIPNDFGIKITSQNIEAHLANLRIQRAKYRATHPKGITEIEALKKK
jgi:hypothetical protein